MNLNLSNVSSKYGAPMGRRNILPEDLTSHIKLHLRWMKMVDHDYDSGGAYWGSGNLRIGWMCVAWGEDAEQQIQVFVRAKTRTEAKKLVKDEIPGARFYR